jgi:hypothetical protein
MEPRPYAFEAGRFSTTVLYIWLPCCFYVLLKVIISNLYVFSAWSLISEFSEPDSFCQFSWPFFFWSENLYMTLENKDSLFVENPSMASDWPPFSLLSSLCYIFPVIILLTHLFYFEFWDCFSCLLSFFDYLFSLARPLYLYSWTRLLEKYSFPFFLEKQFT